MNIVQIIGLGAKKFGGLERFMLELARQLETKGDKLIIVFDAEPRTVEYVRLLSTTNAEWFVIPFANKVRYFKSLYQLFKKYKPLLVQTHFCNSVSVLLVRIASKLNGLKYQFAYEHCFPEINSLRLKLVYKVILTLNEKMFCVSEASFNAIKQEVRNSEKKILTLFLGVEDFNYDKVDTRIKYNLPVDKIIIANVAYHNIVKGVDILLDAVKILRDTFDNKNFVICQIGGGQTGEDTKLLYKQSEKLGISDSIIWMGIQNNVPEILSACDIYCQPSRSEGVGLSIMEASLALLPVVATNVGGIPEVVNENNGILVQPESPIELADALNKILDNNLLRKEMGENGRKYALGKFNIKLQVSRLITEYEKAFKQ